MFLAYGFALGEIMSNCLKQTENANLLGPLLNSLHIGATDTRDGWLASWLILSH